LSIPTTPKLVVGVRVKLVIVPASVMKPIKDGWLNGGFGSTDPYTSYVPSGAATVTLKRMPWMLKFGGPPSGPNEREKTSTPNAKTPRSVVIVRGAPSFKLLSNLPSAPGGMSVDSEKKLLGGNLSKTFFTVVKLMPGYMSSGSKTPLSVALSSGLPKRVKFLPAGSFPASKSYVMRPGAAASKFNRSKKVIRVADAFGKIAETSAKAMIRNTIPHTTYRLILMTFSSC